ncbi:MAG TPA: hypothetical protein VE820_12285 [Sphingomicrobium sp.]|nr:hypothetical protein [Sphingomicrobium sp.]
MPQIDEPITPAPKATPETKKPKPASPSESAVAGIYSFTVDTGSNRIVTVERVDSDGTRHALTAEEKTKLAKSPPAMPLRRLVERAFEAGVDYVLGGDSDGEPPETKEEGELSGILVQTMIKGSKASELVKGDTLDRTVIDTLIVHATK